MECGMPVEDCSGPGVCVEIGGGADCCCWNTEVSEFEAEGAMGGAACSGWVFA